MRESSLQRFWLKCLGGKREYAGLGILTIGILMAALGFAIAYLSPDPKGEHFSYWVGFAVAWIGGLTAAVGIALNFKIMAVRFFGRKDDA
jgi:drug/metabolite transporter (DMT)-like permease